MAGYGFDERCSISCSTRTVFFPKKNSDCLWDPFNPLYKGHWRPLSWVETILSVFFGYLLIYSLHGAEYYLEN
jgi:hypothetical protein